MKNVYALLLALLGLVCIIFNRFAIEESLLDYANLGLVVAATSLAWPDRSDSVGDIFCPLWPSDPDGLYAVKFHLRADDQLLIYGWLDDVLGEFLLTYRGPGIRKFSISPNPACRGEP
jgi:hypothetical protein